jgi:hypothetical protein
MIDERLFAEDIDAHRRNVGLICGNTLRLEQTRHDLHTRTGFRRRRFLAKLDDPARRVDAGSAKPGDLIFRAGLDRDGDVGLVLDVVAEKLAEIHAVHVVAGEDQDVVTAELSEDMQIVAHRIGSTLEPGLQGRGLLGGENLHVASGERVESIGASDVAVKRHRIELGEHVHALHARVDGIRDRDIDQPVLGGHRHRRLAAPEGQWSEALATPTAEDQYGDIEFALFQSAHLLPLARISRQCSRIRRHPKAGPRYHSFQKVGPWTERTRGLQSTFKRWAKAHPTPSSWAARACRVGFPASPFGYAVARQPTFRALPASLASR